MKKAQKVQPKKKYNVSETPDTVSRIGVQLPHKNCGEFQVDVVDGDGKTIGTLFLAHEGIRFHARKKSLLPKGRIPWASLRHFAEMFQ